MNDARVFITSIITIVSKIFYITVLASIIFLQHISMAAEQEYWVYVMCIRHESLNISINCLDSYDSFLSSKNPMQQLSEPDFSNFSIFGKKGTVEIVVSFIPQVSEHVYYVTNDIVLANGETCMDFNGFSITAEKDALVVSNGRIAHKITERKNWEEITSMGTFKYGGHICSHTDNFVDSENIQKWQDFFKGHGFEIDMNRFTAQIGIKEHHLWRNCISPTDRDSHEYVVYSVYIPHCDVIWWKRKIWYTSSSKTK